MGERRLHQTVREATVGAPVALELAQPRKGIVREARDTRSGPPDLASTSTFSQEEGPLAVYRRTLELRALGDGRAQVRQVVQVRLGIPWWSWFLALPLRRELGRLSPGPQPGRSPGLPWWAPPERLDRRTTGVLAALAALSAVQGFIGGLLPETLSYAGSEMRVGTFGQGVVFGAVELSALPALLALVLADRRGRRGVALGATAGAVAFSELSAASPALGWLTGTQLAVGALVAAAAIAVTVIAVEEVPKGCRAWSLGILGLAAGFGAGAPLALLPLAGLGSGGWRWLYWSSLACLPVVWRCARQLPESRRWAAAAKSPLATPLPLATGQARPWSSAGGRLALVCLGAALFALFATPAGQFETQFLRHERHYSAVAISVLEQVAGTVGSLGVLFGGRLADTHGRRPVAAAAVAGATAATVAGYLAGSGAMWAALIAAQFFLYATGPALGVYGAELFTTASRARSAGLVAAAAAVGGVLGTVATGGLDDVTGHLGTALAVMAIGPLLLVVLLLAAYPETAAVELEQLSAAGSTLR